MLVTIAWGDYWERFGERFEAECQELNQHPERIVVISDKPIKTRYENVVFEPENVNLNDTHILNHYRRKSVEICDCDWLIQHDIDDEMYPNYCDDLKDDYDVHMFYLHNGEQIVLTYDQFAMINGIRHLKSDHLPLGGWMNSAIKKSMLDKCDAYKLGFGFEDMILSCDIFHHHGKFYTKDRTYRGKINRHTHGSLTKRNQSMSKQKILETRIYFERLFK